MADLCNIWGMLRPVMEHWVSSASAPRWRSLVCQLAFGWLGCCALATCQFDSQASPRCKGASCAAQQGDGALDASTWAPVPSPGTKRRTELRSQTSGASNATGAAADAAVQMDTRGRADDEDAGRVRSPQTSAEKPPAKPCDGERPSRAELCNAIDDDCDGKLDEQCACSDAERVACYDGPEGTRDVGRCRAGKRRCEPGMLGECVDWVGPTAETCNGMDDDCNGTVDDGFALAEDESNCGFCGNTCQKGETCCAGRCVNVMGTDVQHCGGCGQACGQGAAPGCCDGRCVDLLTDQNCGSCTNACGLLKLGGGFLCTCKPTAMGPACVGDTSAEELMLCK